jgi:hypothetical protein
MIDCDAMADRRMKAPGVTGVHASIGSRGCHDARHFFHSR